MLNNRRPRDGSVPARLLLGLVVYWRTLVFIITPLALLPLVLLVKATEASCAYALILMAVYWVTEALPLPVTALIPFVLFPTLGLATGNVIASKYISGSTITFMGGMIMALAIEKSQLHRRLALKLLMTIGSKPSSIAIGFILPTWFLSMWISNTATTAMMITVVQSVIDRLSEGIKKSKELKQRQSAANPSFITDEDPEEHTYFGSSATHNHVNETAIAPSVNGNSSYSTSSSLNHPHNTFTTKPLGPAHDDEDESEEERHLKQFARMLCLIIAYSSNIGGLATLTGTPTNLLVAELANDVFERHGQPAPLSYATWLMYGLPTSLLCLVVMWAWLQFYFLSWRSFCYCCKKYRLPGQDVGLGDMVKNEYEKLGNVTFYEMSALIFLILMVVLWFARDPGFAPGYGKLFKPGYVNDGVPAMLIAILLFVFPTHLPKLSCLKGSAVSRPALMDWQTVSTKMPWGPILILGGGYALAHACQVSGLSNLVGAQLNVLQNLPAWVMVLLITILVTFFTEITSNAAVISIINPILVAMSAELGVNPLYMMLPAGLAASCAYMLPVATPPNAIVFSYGHLKVIHMVKAGFVLNILCILVITLGIHTWGQAIFDVYTLPWDSSVNTNSTTVSQLTVTASISMI